MNIYYRTQFEFGEKTHQGIKYPVATVIIETDDAAAHEIILAALTELSNNVS